MLCLLLILLAWCFSKLERDSFLLFRPEYFGHTWIDIRFSRNQPNLDLYMATVVEEKSIYQLWPIH